MKHLHLETSQIHNCFGTVIYGNGVEDSHSRRAFLRGDLLCFETLLPRQLGCTEVSIVIRSDSTGEKKILPLHWQGIAGARDVYTGQLPADSLAPDLYFLRVEAKAVGGSIMSVRTSGVECSFASLDDGTFTYQLTVCDFAYQSPEWLKGGVIYHVFVDRFCKSGNYPLKPGAILNEDWENGLPQYPEYPGAYLENNMFFGGDLDGVTNKLDYIASLGVNCIYLSPIFEAYSNHKYDTGDYMRVDSMFGGDEALARLIERAREYGIRIVLDGVFNHTGDDSIYFNRKGRYDGLGACQTKTSPYYEWYEFQEYPHKYTCWWGIPTLPRINTENPSCYDYFVGEQGVLAKYAEMGIGGIRLDVADELSDKFIDGVKSRLSATIPDHVLWGEVWEDASNKEAYGHRRRYFQGKQLDGVMNYVLRRGIISYFVSGDTGPLTYALCEVMPNTPKRVQDLQMNLLGTHDTIRIMNALCGRDREGRSNAELATAHLTSQEYAMGVKRLKMAYLMLATMPGIPHIYYGDEVGMEGYQDPFNRMPFPWHRMNEELLAFYQKIGKIRREYDVWKEGAFKLLHLSANAIVYIRYGKSQNCLIAINRGDSQLHIRVNKYTKALLSGAAIGRDITVPPCEGCIFTYTSRGNEMTLEKISY